MEKEIFRRVEQEADYIMNTKTTVRKIAEKFGISKSTVHKDLKEKLKEINEEKYRVVQEIFKEHIKIRHILGGQSTKNKYLQLRENNEG